FCSPFPRNIPRPVSGKHGMEEIGPPEQTESLWGVLSPQCQAGANDSGRERTLAAPRIPRKRSAMHSISSIRFLVCGLMIGLMLVLCSQSFAQVGVGIYVNLAPPDLPVYDQPECPGPDYIWTPGFWAWSDDIGYFWVPGTWVLAPEPGYYWTPGYWA